MKLKNKYYPERDSNDYARLGIIEIVEGPGIAVKEYLSLPIPFMKEDHGLLYWKKKWSLH